MSENIKSIPHTYLADYDELLDREILITATLFVDKKPTRWAVKRGNFCMSKTDGFWNLEPSPSNRDESFFQEYRFTTALEAEQAYFKFHGKQ